MRKQSRLHDNMELPEIIFSSHHLKRKSNLTSTPQPPENLTDVNNNRKLIPVASPGDSADLDDTLEQDIELPSLSQTPDVGNITPIHGLKSKSITPIHGLKSKSITPIHGLKSKSTSPATFHLPQIHNGQQGKLDMSKVTSKKLNVGSILTLSQRASNKDRVYAKILEKSKKRRKTDGPNRSPIFPDVNIPSLNKRELTGDIIHGPETELPTPFSQTDRKINVVRNNMYGNVLRKSTKKLQDDLRQTMRVYSSEKHQLLQQLADLRHEMDEQHTSDQSTSPTSSVSTTDNSVISTTRSSRFYHAPNIAARKLDKRKKKERPSKLMEAAHDTKMGNHFLKSKDIGNYVVKLPTIRSSSPADKRGPEWNSGNIMENSLPPIEQPQGIAAAKALLEHSFKIPVVSDPQREDIALSQGKLTNRSEKKKVHFSEFNKVTEFINDTYDSKNYVGTGGSYYPPQGQRGRGSKKGRSDKGLMLAPLKRTNDPKEAQKVAAEYKALYLSIQDPEVRTRTLADILHAVRVRMHENETQLKFNESPRPVKADNSLCDFLLKTSPRESKDDVLPPLDPSKTRRQYHGAPNNTAARVGRRSNATQLQNYLRKMSKSRRMIEHMEAEQYRMAHINGHRPLQEASQYLQAATA